MFFWMAFLPLIAGNVCPVFDPGSGPGYKPGTPGGPWTAEEVSIVKEKVMTMIHPDNVNLYADAKRFPPIVNRVFGDGDVWSETPNNVANSSGIFYNRLFPRSSNDLSPTSRKLVRLAFHDCLRSTDSHAPCPCQAVQIEVDSPGRNGVRPASSPEQPTVIVSYCVE